MTHVYTSNSNTEDSVKAKLRREKFALLARVGVNKRKALAFQEAEEFYSTIVTGLLVRLVARYNLLVEIEKQTGSRLEEAVWVTSELTRLLKPLLSYWPQNTESQLLIWNLLASDGLETVMTTTPEGYVTLSSDLILGNVERIIDLTREQNQRLSSGSETPTLLQAAGTDGNVIAVAS